MTEVENQIKQSTEDSVDTNISSAETYAFSADITQLMNLII